MNKTFDVPFHARHEDELLTLDEVAEILQTSPNTVRWWRQLGTGPEFFKIGRHLYATVGRPSPVHPRAAPRRPTRHRSIRGDVRHGRPAPSCSTRAR